MKLILSLSFLVALSCGAVAVAQSEPPTVLCKSCGNRGARDCSRHRKWLEIERGVVFCSEAAACKKCRGALRVDCKICTNPATEQGLVERRRLVAEWYGARKQQLEDFTRGKGEDFLHIKTANLDLNFSAWPLTVGKRKLDNHQLAHLYADRIEALRTEFKRVFELTDRDFPREDDEVSPRMRVWVTRKPGDHRLIAPRATGIGSRGPGVKLMGIQLAYSILHDRKMYKDDDALHRNIAHTVAHLLLSSTNDTQWIGNRGHGWIDEGVAHYFEYQVDGRCANFCYEEVGLNPGSNFKGGYWRVAVRKLIESGKSRRFTEFYTKNSDQLDFQDHAQAFAAVEFLIGEFGGAKFRDLVRAVKREEPTRDAMQRLYGFGPLMFDEKMSVWVRQNYPLQRR